MLTMFFIFAIKTPGQALAARNPAALVRGFIICLFLYFSGCNSVAQVYPGWFLTPEKLGVSHAVAGYAEPAFYADSAITQAYYNACENYAKETTCQYSGGQFYWATEIGVYWIGNDVQEKFDSSATAAALTILAPADTFIADGVVMILATSEPPAEASSLFALRNTKKQSPPGWIKELPQDSEFIYATGLAPLYFHEKSSWLQAEQRARRNLAQTIFLTVSALGKSAAEGQDIRTEEMGLTTIRSQVIARWFDAKDEVCHVLVKMKKS